MAHPPNSEGEPSSKSSNKRRFDVLTLFPEILEPVFSASLLGKARERGLVETRLTQIRDFATDRHRTVDDTPYGGGEGMVLKADVLSAALKSVLPEGESGALTVLMSPQGRPLTSELAKELSLASHLILVCGHYEGVDERFIDAHVDLEVSIGDYVLTGGELAAAVVIDAVSRWIPGVVGKEASVSGDSFEGEGLLKYPQYTKPREWEGRAVPEVLLGGNHKEIAAWRQAESRARTLRKRPDLVARGTSTEPLAKPGKRG